MVARCEGWEVFYNLLKKSILFKWACVSGLWASHMFLQWCRFLSSCSYFFCRQQGFQSVSLNPWTLLTIFPLPPRWSFRWLDWEEPPFSSWDKDIGPWMSFPLEYRPMLWWKHRVYFIMITLLFPLLELCEHLSQVFIMWTCLDSCRESPCVQDPLRLWSPVLATCGLM